LSEAQQLEFIEVIDTSHMTPNDIHTLKGEWFLLLPNTDIWPGWQKADAILPYKWETEPWFFSSTTMKLEPSQEFDLCW
jgi:hypothetical protein